MQVRVNRLREVLTLLKPVVARKTDLPILKNILFRDGSVMATDLETLAIIPMREADTTCLLPFAELEKMIQFIQGGEIMEIEPRDGVISLKWSDGRTTFGAKDPKDYPDAPKFEPKAEGIIDSDALIPAMMSVLPYAATEEGRPTLNGVTVLMGEPFEVAAGDGHRMAYQVLPLSFPENVPAIVRPASVKALYHFWQKTPRNPPPSDSLVGVITAKKQATVAFDGKTGLRFTFDRSATVIVKLVEGSPPAFVKLIPKGKPIFQAQIMASDLMLAVRRAAGVAAYNSDIIRMMFNDGAATISAKVDDADNPQEIESSIKTFSPMGEPNKVALDAKSLLEYLGGKEGVVTLSWEKDGEPVLLQHQKTPKVLIMPMAPEAATPPAAKSEPAAPAASSETAEEAKTPQEPTPEPKASTKKKKTSAKSSKNRGKKVKK